MAERAEKIGQGLERIHERLQELERRVAALEKREELPASAPVETFLGVTPKEKEKRAGSTSVVPLMGKAVLGIAGAYLLRAVAESGAAPRWAMLTAGIAYAGVWLVWAARSHRRSHFASVIFGLTAAMILPPLLWEGTVRFQALTAGFAAAVLVGMVALSLGLAWKERLEAIPWIVTMSAVVTAMVLIIATHELRALTVALLAMALVTEAVGGFGRWLSLRVVTGVAADFAVGLVGVLMTSAGGVPASYRAMSGGEVNAYGVALMAIYGGSVGVRAFVLGKKLTVMEVAQAGVAFGLGTWMSLQATQGGSARALGAVFLMLAVVCYWGALKRFAGTRMEEKGAGEIEDTGVKTGATLGAGTQDAGLKTGATLGAGTRDAGVKTGATLGAGTQDAGLKPGATTRAGTQDAGLKPGATGDGRSKDRPLHELAEMRWNRRVSANYAAGLVLAGSVLMLEGNIRVVALSVAAMVVVVWVFTRTKYLSLGMQGTYYLVAAGMGCGMFGYMAKAMAGTVPGWPAWSAWVMVVAALASYLAGSRASGEGRRERVLWVAPAAIAGSALAALAVAGMAGVGTGEISASRLSMVRTVVTCVTALGLGYAGSRWNRVELGWVAYGAIGLGALKLVVEDLRYGSAGTLMVSLLFYGLILILLPRVTRFGRVEV